MKYKELEQITKIERDNDTTTWYHVGENFIIEISRIDHDLKNKHDLMNEWRRSGYIKKRLNSHINVDTYYTDKSGTCYGWYNPTVKMHPNGGRMIIDFDYLREYNAENVNYLLAKCIEMFNNDHKIKKCMYQNIENGNVFECSRDGYNEMIKEAEELYDYGDPTNALDIEEYYRIITVEE